MRRGTRRWARLLAMCVAAPLAMVMVGAVPPAASAAPRCVQPGGMIKPIPWQQQVLSPERVWPLTHGGQITVAVLASGVDADVGQLRGHVAAGYDALTGRAGADDDCVGVGTQVAGVIAGQQADGTGFSGLAPGVTILPVRVVSAATVLAGAPVNPDVLGVAIDWAVDHHADVIAAPLPAYADSGLLHAAVNEALARHVLIVAGVGDEGDQGTKGGPTPYPASYTPVLGVAAIDQKGQRAVNSQYGPYVDIAAPGADVVTLQAGGGMVTVSGTGVACGFVAAAAALVLARHRDLSADDLRNRLTATATTADGGSASLEFGAGVVNPYAAVTDEMTGARPAALPGLPAPQAEEDRWAGSRRLAWLGTGVALLAVLLVLMLAVALPRGRRRGWRLGLAARPVQEPEVEPGPPVLLFEEPTP